MQAMILAGGLGTRLAPVVADRAKPVALVGGRPFLEHVLEQVARCGEVDEVVLCVGHRSETVREALGAGHGRLPIRYSRESRPLGTGGALRLAASRGRMRGPALAMNGDSFLGVSLDRLLAFHRETRALATLALARVPDATRYGAAMLEGDRVVAFREKGHAGPAWVNAGIYVLSQRALDRLRAAPAAFSFEQGALAPWCAEREVRGLRSRARFVDIGTPEDYRRSAALLGGGKAPC